MRSSTKSNSSAKRGTSSRRTSSAQGARGSSARSTSTTRSGSTAAARTQPTRRRAQSKMTTDHEEIRQWAEARGAHPSVVKNTRAKNAGSIGVLRLDFPGYSGEGSLEPISWDQFFETFDEHQLALVYQDKTAAGKASNFNKLVKREDQETGRT